MIPVGDTPNPRGVPVGNYLLITINVAVYLLLSLPLSLTAVNSHDPNVQAYVAMLREQVESPAVLRQALSNLNAYDVFVFIHGFKPQLPQLADLFVSLFLHANIMHLFGNMLFLWIYGDNVEHRLGTVGYLLAYLGCGVVATLVHALFALDSPLPLIGASGAISGVLGCYFKWFPRNKVRLLIFFFPVFMDTILVPARVVLFLYLALDNVLPFLARGGAEGGVAYGAHIGGFGSGLALAWWLDRRGLRETPEYLDADSRSSDAPPRARSLNELIDAGDYAAAAERYFAMPAARTSGALTPRSSIHLADWLREQGHPHAALNLYRRHLRDFPRGPARAEAHLGAGVTHLNDFGDHAAAYQHFLDALDAHPDANTAARAREGLAAIAAHRRDWRGRSY